MLKIIEQEFNSHLKIASKLIVETLIKGNKILLCGNGGKMNSVCDNIAKIEEMHILFNHTICQLVDEAFEK